MANFSEEITNALENVIETKVQERCQGLIAENTRLFVEKQELGNRIQNLETENMELRAKAVENSDLTLEIENDNLKAKNMELTKTLETLESIIEKQKEELGAMHGLVRENVSLITKLQSKENQICSLAETLDRARDLMRVLDDEFGDLERNVRDIESSIGELQRELEEEDD